MRLFVGAFLSALAVFAWARPARAVYDLPDDDSDCPAGCRKIPWSAGSDQFNGGVLPTYEGVDCSAGLTEGDGTTDNTSAINACISDLSDHQAAVLPPGIFYVSGTISIPSNKVLRGSGSTDCSEGTWLSADFHGDTGAGATCTTLKFGPGGRIRIGTSNPSFGSAVAISSGYDKGSRSLVLGNSSHGLSEGDWISIHEDDDPDIVCCGNGGCTWCGDNSGANLIQQFAQVTSVAGATIGISRPMYYTYKPDSHPEVTKTAWNVQTAGLEDIKLNGYEDTGEALISVKGALFCWVRGVETYDAGAGAKDGHLMTEFSHGCEYRDGYHHFGRSGSSDRNYGIYFFFWNSDHKVENNILRHHRHSVVLEGGGSGFAFLYNYIDDNYTDDLSYLGSARTNHGPHPMFDLWEGNQISHLEADSVFGGSSQIVYFRNWLRGGESEIGLPDAPDCGFAGLDIRGGGWYHAAVGNVLGEPGWSSGSVLVSPDTSCAPGIYSSTRHAYFIGCNPTDDTSLATTIKHGNYDYVSDGVAYWDGGGDHALRSSLYYDAPPAWWDCRPWPVFGPDVDPVAQDIPAKDRFEGEVYTCPDQTCSQLGGACCPAGQQCTGGSFSSSADCEARCCLMGVCEDPALPDGGIFPDGDASGADDGPPPGDSGADTPGDETSGGPGPTGGCSCSAADRGLGGLLSLLAAAALLWRRRRWM